MSRRTLDSTRIRALVDGGDAVRLVTEVVREGPNGMWGRGWTLLADALATCPDEFRIEIALAGLDLGDGYMSDTLAEVVLRDVPLGEHLDAVEALLSRAAGFKTHYAHDFLTRLATVWLEAGRELPGPVLGVIRRTARAAYGRVPLQDLVDPPGHPALSSGEPWADRVLADLAVLGDEWRALAAHAVTATSARPSEAWERRARRLLDAVGPEPARAAIVRWLALVGRPRSIPVRHMDDAEFDPHNAFGVRGLAWMLAFLPGHPDSARTLGTLVETALRKVPGLGPRSPLVANAAVHALSLTDGGDALAQLARLSARVTYKGTLKVLNTALDTRAAALGLSREEVEELAVPVYGLTEVGRRVERLGEAVAELTVTGTRTALTWRNAAGRPVKSPPAGVRRDHAGELAELKASAKDIGKMLAAQAERLDQQFLAERSWPYGVWRERYLDHPLVGTLGRRLIWLVDGVPYGYADGALRDVDDAPVAPAADATVRLWHPIGRDTAEVLAWRDWLERHRITQPFKQAHREIYLLTAAEENTRVYSNRYAAHVLRQHQFHALAALRGWRNRLRIMADDSHPPAVRELPRWGLRAEFWIGGVGDDYGVDTTDSGAYLRLTTDQVRFYPITAPDNHAHAADGCAYEQGTRGGAAVGPVPLDEVPPLVLSEVMRDIDLFVGVASVGNDPTWQDGGPDGRFRDYWTSYSFGELSGTAQTRRDLLTRLVPRLAIADRCTVEGRFLHVRGDLRTYKIHLGSGNILMTPDDRYLCIVPGRAAETDDGQVFLPFEGDRVLAVILSKAVLLAGDTAITDPTITHQIRR
ncbi:DUF4132 domain-containing protein [Planomonospora sp. ID91781]|uniref:DUF4132 domain-containing protein n=1 Tax=Planomonospora sp. ID91781 TaxID=2738135 RepID=UPI0018C42F83|nr:DUF4132 domain-containing protein [Planomonospora sp. ID91781]MBG0820062.1 DUF4132 domain-containing protein [Planomonospora sp. ID91781]